MGPLEMQEVGDWGKSKGGEVQEEESGGGIQVRGPGR